MALFEKLVSVKGVAEPSQVLYESALSLTCKKLKFMLKYDENKYLESYSDHFLSYMLTKAIQYRVQPNAAMNLKSITETGNNFKGPAKCSNQGSSRIEEESRVESVTGSRALSLIRIKLGIHSWLGLPKQLYAWLSQLPPSFVFCRNST